MHSKKASPQFVEFHKGTKQVVEDFQNLMTDGAETKIQHKASIVVQQKRSFTFHNLVLLSRRFCPSHRSFDRPLCTLEVLNRIADKF